jgi:hypothetical protein
MSLELKPRKNDLSCVYDAFVYSYEAGLLEPGAEEIIHYLPDDFPMHSLQQLCSMVKAKLHFNCSSAVPADEQMIHFFANPETLNAAGFVVAHAEFLRPSDLSSYLETYGHIRLIGFIAFSDIECSPIQDTLGEYHVPTSVRTLTWQEGPVAA